MSRIESAAKSAMTQLMYGQPIMLDRVQQFFIASLLCLIASRNEFSRLGATAISNEERTWLRTHCMPPWNWQIWIARYRGERQNEHWCYHYPMQIGPTPEEGSCPTSEIGDHKCNTQTTTLVIGQLTAHLFSSTAMPEFPGYQGIRLCKIWPPNNWFIDWSTVPAYGERNLFSLAAALSRDIPPADATD